MRVRRAAVPVSRLGVSAANHTYGTSQALSTRPRAHADDTQVYMHIDTYSIANRHLRALPHDRRMMPCMNVKGVQQIVRARTRPC